jgi:prepilin-type N-terminal cleavage/methylation domain-containing protein
MNTRRYQLTNNSLSSGRIGFTLLELIVVLAILVVVGAMSIPLLQGTLLSSRLQSGATQVRSAMANARVKSMTSGVPMILEYELETDRYKIKPASNFVDELEASTGAAMNEELFVLPEGVKFLSVQTSESRPVDTSQTADQLGQGTITSSQSVIHFYPDGSCSTASIQIGNERDAKLVISLRGITGVALVSDPSVETLPQTDTTQSQGGL